MFTKKSGLLVFLTFYVILFLFYYPSQNGILYVNDAMLNMYEFESTGWKGILHSYNMIFLWYVPSVLYFICYKLFGLHLLGWHAVLCLLHTINAFLFMLFFRMISKTASSTLIIIIGFVFLISPFQTEVVAWNALFHYSLSVLFLLSGLITLLNYFRSFDKKYIIGFHFLFICSLFCFEQSFLFPFVFLSCAVFIVPVLYPISWKQSLWKSIQVFFIGNMLSIFAYFVITKLNYGVWIAHYGADAHTNISLKNIYENLLNYHWKFLFYYRYIPETIRRYYNYVLLHKMILILFPCLLAGLAFYFYKSKFYLQDKAKIVLFLYSSFLLLLVPVLNLDSSFTFEIQSDRYGYSASLFFYALIFYSLSLFADKRFVYVLSVITIALNSYFLMNAVDLWNKSGNLSVSLLKSYPLQPAQKSFLLNLPDNYSGVYTMRNGFNEGLSIIHKKNYKGATKPIAWVNVFSSENETSSEILNDSTYYVKCIKTGKWYYYMGKGAVDYETDDIKVDFDEWNTAYTLTFKKKPEDSVFLLQCTGDKWKIVDTIIPVK